MARSETLTAYKCSFEYLQRNNPLKEDFKDKIKAKELPEYSFADFIEDFAQYTSAMATGKATERAILLPTENVHVRVCLEENKRWRIVPYAGKQGKPFRIIKTSTGRRYDFGSDSAALYEHNIFMYQSNETMIAIFHRQSGSGCKSVFLEVANNMLREKGIKMEMELYLPLVAADDSVQPTKIHLQYVRTVRSSDVAENIHNRKPEVIQELGLNLESRENNGIKAILQDLKMGRINKDVAFARIKQQLPNTDVYNEAEVFLRIGKRNHKVRWGEFDALLGNYDITDDLHSKFKITGDFIAALSELTDEYYNSIIVEENVDAE